MSRDYGQFQFPVQMRFNELMTGARQDVVVKILEMIWMFFPKMLKTGQNNRK
jgi:hypothetical protein